MTHLLTKISNNMNGLTDDPIQGTLVGDTLPMPGKRFILRTYKDTLHTSIVQIAKLESNGDIIFDTENSSYKLEKI